MGEAGAGQQDMRVIIMVDRREQAARFEFGGDVHRVALGRGCHGGGQADALRDGMQRQSADRGEADHEGRAVALRGDNAPFAALGTVLQQAQCHENLSSRAPLTALNACRRHAIVHLDQSPT